MSTHQGSPRGDHPSGRGPVDGSGESAPGAGAGAGAGDGAGARPSPPPPPRTDPGAVTVPGLPREGSAPGGRRRAARRGHRPARLERLRRLVPQALVVVAPAGGTWAFLAHDKAVRLSVDGRQRTLHTFAADIGELLDEEGVRLGPHDAVDPVPGRVLADGDRIAVRRGKPLDLTVDTERRPRWTTADTVLGALRELRVPAEGAHLSVPHWAGIPRSGLVLEVRTARTVRVTADGHERTLRTNAGTVRDAVEEAGAVLRGRDTTVPPPDSFPRDRAVLRVLRARGEQRNPGGPAPYPASRRTSPDILGRFPRGTAGPVPAGAAGFRAPERVGGGPSPPRP
ncbi:ubiquitin-like domain-containing protein [Streptomyces albus]|uniref:ubiquitin-like domain-containing protein n=1 Tax=Streptomyces albus TaxID=1888 RepID=UPI00099CEF46